MQSRREEEPMPESAAEFHEIRAGLRWTLAVDLCGTAALCVASMLMGDVDAPAAAYYQALALVAVVGAALAIVSVTVAAGTLIHSAPSRRALLVSETAAALGVALNTAGVVWVLYMPHHGHVGAAILLLCVGDALGGIYLVLTHRARAATPSAIGHSPG